MASPTIWGLIILAFSTVQDQASGGRIVTSDPSVTAWPDNQLLYYLDPNYTAAEKDLIRQYANKVQDQTMGCVKIVETTAADKRFKAKITPLTNSGSTESYCSVFPGVLPGLTSQSEQRMVVARGDSGCLDEQGVGLSRFWTVALGRRNEHQRGDRDMYIKVNQANLAFPDSYRLYSAKEAFWAGRPYDYCSVTHDAPADFSKPGTNAFTYVQGPPSMPADLPPALSQSDCQIIRNLYACDPTPCKAIPIRAGCSSTYYSYYPGPAVPANAKQQVVDLLTALFTGAPATAVNYINDHKYIQHNQNAADGKGSFANNVIFAATNPSPAPKFVRVFQDNDLVFVHSENVAIAGTPASIVWDVFRFEDGQIVEHWDQSQDRELTKTNGAGHTMTDGPTQSRDLDKTDANKVVVKNFVNDVLVNGKTETASSYFASSPPYIQHNPDIPADGFAATAAYIAKLPPGTKLCSRIRRLMGEGDFVLTLCDGTVGSQAYAFYDLYRVENGKIAEHWDIIGAIPPVSEWNSFNGKF